MNYIFLIHLLIKNKKEVYLPINFSTEKKMKNQSPNKKENSFLFSTSLIFEQNIDKLWIHLKDLSAETKIVHFLDNFKFIKGENTWTPGNIFSLYWIGVSNIEIKCISSFSTRMKKKIKWKFKCDIGISYYKTMILYRITDNNKTLVKIIITRCEKNKLVDFSPQMNYYMNLQYDILNYQSKYLNNIIKDKSIFQSCIIDKNHEKIWDFVIDFKNISKLCPDFVQNIEYKGEKNEVGSFLKFSILDSKKVSFYKITKFETPIKTNIYRCQFEAVGTDIINIPFLAEIQLILIKPNNTYFSILLNFKESSSEEIVNNFLIKLKNLINKIKEYVKENEKEFNIE